MTAIIRPTGALADVYEHAVAGVMRAWDETQSYPPASEHDSRRSSYEAAARKALAETFTIIGCRFVAAEEQP